MILPGFTAEATLYSKQEHYRVANNRTQLMRSGTGILAQVRKVPTTEAECARRGLCFDGEFDRCVSCGGGGSDKCNLEFAACNAACLLTPSPLCFGGCFAKQVLCQTGILGSILGWL